MREILKTLPEPLDSIFYTKVCGTSYYDTGHKTKAKTAQGHRFGYVITGKALIVSGGKKYPLDACDVYYLPKGTTFDFYTDKKENFSNIWFESDGQLIEKLTSTYGADCLSIFKNCRIFNLFDEYCKNINTMIERGAAERDNAIILHRIISESVSKSSAFASLQNENDALTLKEYIDANFVSNVSNADLAKLINKSESQTIRIFKKAYSKTPYDYLLERKTEAAKQLLKSTAMSVRDISNALGFSNEHYFSSCFKKHAGITPLKYRKS